MSFCFNFPSPESVEEKHINVSKACEQAFLRVERDKLSFVPCGFMCMKNNTVESCTSKDVNQVRFGTVNVKYSCLKSLKEKTENKDLLSAENLQSDLIPGKYEGGFKVWESSFDLSQFLLDENVIKPSDKVLELGCGAGFPGIIAYLKGASVTFQDFNFEVLELLTIPNVLLNSPDLSSCQAKCEFLYGDWSCIKEKYFSKNQDEIIKYDIILTSETIYDKSSMKKLLDLMKSSLKLTGIVYLAAKTHYFGVGGGIVDFEDLVMTDGTFEISDVHKIEAGLERQILKMKFK